MLATVPLLIIPLVIYNMIAFLTPGLEWDTVLLSLPMVSGVSLNVKVGDVFVLASLVFLFLEIVKATSASTRSIVDHMLSTLVFIAALVEFLLVAAAATSTFLILLALMLLDIVAGYSVSIRVARRDFAIEPRSDL